MKVLITGANGQLGWHLKQVFADCELYLGDTDNYDITNRELILAETEKFRPALIIHAAAYTNVDGAETNQALCRAINVDGSRHVAEAAAAVDAVLVAISTDYVFAGDKGEPYQESDSVKPLSFYGQTKAEGEQAVMATTAKHFITRTAWLYGGPKPTPETDWTTAILPKNFINTMLRVGLNRPSIEVVDDQIGAPTYAADLSQAIRDLAATKRYGIYHLTNSGTTNWAAVAEFIFETVQHPTTVTHIKSADWQANNPSATKRPAYSVLGHAALTAAGLPGLRAWQAALADYLSEFDHE